MTDPGPLYDRASTSYGTVGPPIFDVLGDQLAELAAVGAGDRVVDIGCGRGAALLPALRRCGEQGAALGVDVSFEMVRQTSGLLKKLENPPGGVLQGSAAAVPVAGQTVDRLLCAFTVFWLSDPRACFEEMRRVVKRGGVVGVSMTSASDERWSWYGDLLVEYHDAHGVLAQQPVGNGLNQHPQVLEGALVEAGFVDTKTVSRTTTFQFPSFESWWHFQWSHGARLPLEAMSESVLLSFKEDCRSRITAMTAAGPIHQDWPMAFTLAT
jgi:SAM-dependent methyltransferase